MTKIRTSIMTLCLLLVASPPDILGQLLPGGGASQGQTNPAVRGRGMRGSRAVEGQVVSDGVRRIDHPIAVHLDRMGQPSGIAFTDGNGNFSFDNDGSRARLYVSVDVPGFRPERMEVTRGSSNVIVLESLETVEASPEVRGPVDLSQLLADIPDDAVEAFNRAAQEARNGDHERAVQELEKAVEIAPEFYEAQNTLGAEYQLLGRLDDAISQFEIALELNPNAASPALSLGVLYFQESNRQSTSGQADEGEVSLQKAFGYLEAAADRDPASALAQYYFGAVLHETGANERALAHLERTLALNPQFYDARIVLFNVYMAQRDHAAALYQLTAYLSEFPESPQREAVEATKASLEQLLSAH